MDPTAPPPSSSSSLSMIPNPLRDHQLEDDVVRPETATSVGATTTTQLTGVTNSSADDNEGSNKRAAFAGQWRTPENILFPATAAAVGSSSTTTTTSSSSGIAHNVVPSTSLPPVTTSSAPNTSTAMVVEAAPAAGTGGIAGSLPLPSLPLQDMALPDSTEGYAKALQEAYRRGAEAAAALAAQQQQQQQFLMAPSASCPDFQQFNAVATGVAAAPTTTGAPVSSGPRSSPPPVATHVSMAPGSSPQPAMTTSSGVVSAHPPAPSTLTAPTMTSSMSHPVLTSQTLLQQAPRQQQHPQPLPHYQQQQQQLHPLMPPPPAPAPSAGSNATAVSSTVMAMPPPMPPTLQVVHAAAAPAPMASVPVSATAPAPPPQAMVRNSLSMPNMSGGLAHHPNPYHAGLVEEEKRLKRLARNRASARLRRLRKKNLVDAYETEVGILEKTLHALKHHEWGTTLLEAGGGTSPSTSTMSALTEALSMDRGQQALNKQESRDAAIDILRQQLEYISLLEQIMQEQFVLHQVGTLLQGPGGDGSGDAMESDGPSRALLQELVQELQLTPEQMLQLQAAQSGWEEEYSALQTVKQSLEAMINSNWLWNEGSTAVVEEFMSILHKNQVSKFLLWADANVEAIDELDGVNAPSAVPQGPVFTFGVNNNPESLLDEEKA